MGCCKSAEKDFSSSGNVQVQICPDEKYQAHVTKVYDGDTFTADIIVTKLPKSKTNIILTSQSVRIFGIDAPEIKVSTKISNRDLIKKAGLKVRERLCSMILDKFVTLQPTRKKDKYGRILSRVYTTDDKDVSRILIEEGLVNEYSGGKKIDFSNEHLEKIFNS
jgi:endonuclease YncB( thermonuclease family)